MTPLEPAVCAVAAAGAVWLGWQSLGAWCGWRGRVYSGVGALVAGAVLLLPMGGLPGWQWTYSVCPNPSLPLVILVLLGLWRRFGWSGGFQPADWDSAWAFGAIAGTLLYLHPLLPDTWDLYYWGWQHSVTVWVMAALALAALAFGLRFGLVLLGTLGAYELSVLESPNGWDYLVDPIYWFVSLALCARRLWICWRRRPATLPAAG